MQTGDGVDRGANLRQFRHFVALSETLNFSKAADALGIGQAALSASIQKLEERLGVLLFVRTSKSVAPTDAGRRLLDDARALVGQADHRAWPRC